MYMLHTIRRSLKLSVTWRNEKNPGGTCPCGLTRSSGRAVLRGSLRVGLFSRRKLSGRKHGGIVRGETVLGKLFGRDITGHPSAIPQPLPASHSSARRTSQSAMWLSSLSAPSLHHSQVSSGEGLLV